MDRFALQSVLKMAVLIEDEWSGFAQRGRRRHAGVPKIVHSIAGSAYSVQGRTALATVLHLGSAADARGIYVGLTRHVHDARIVVESERLDAVLPCPSRRPKDAAAPISAVGLPVWRGRSIP